MDQIIQLQGTEKRLYQLLAPLVMNPDVLKKNNNYPFKTTADFTWFVAQKNRKVVGFMPVEKRGNDFIINNYYVQDDESDTLKNLIGEAILAFPDKKLLAVVLAQHEPVFADHGFTLEKKWTLYVKMKKE